MPRAKGPVGGTMAAILPRAGAGEAEGGSRGIPSESSRGRVSSGLGNTPVFPFPPESHGKQRSGTRSREVISSAFPGSGDQYSKFLYARPVFGGDPLDPECTGTESSTTGPTGRVETVRDLER